MANSTESTTTSGSEFDLRGLLARITLWGITWLLCISPLFLIDKLPGNQLLRFWQTRGLWWVIALSVASNLVLHALIQWLCNARAERMSVQLWAASSALHFIPYVA